MTGREEEVLDLLRNSDGMRADDVAAALGIKRNTANVHLRALKVANEAHYTVEQYRGRIMRTMWYAGPDPATVRPVRRYASVWDYATRGGD